MPKQDTLAGTKIAVFKLEYGLMLPPGEYYAGEFESSKSIPIKPEDFTHCKVITKGAFKGWRVPFPAALTDCLRAMITVADQKEAEVKLGIGVYSHSVHTKADVLIALEEATGISVVQLERILCIYADKRSDMANSTATDVILSVTREVRDDTKVVAITNDLADVEEIILIGRTVKRPGSEITALHARGGFTKDEKKNAQPPSAAYFLKLAEELGLPPTIFSDASLKEPDLLNDEALAQRVIDAIQNQDPVKHLVNLAHRVKAVGEYRNKIAFETYGENIDFATLLKLECLRPFIQNPAIILAESESKSLSIYRFILTAVQSRTLIIEETELRDYTELTEFLNETLTQMLENSSDESVVLKIIGHWLKFSCRNNPFISGITEHEEFEEWQDSIAIFKYLDSNPDLVNSLVKTGVMKEVLKDLDSRKFLYTLKPFLDSIFITKNLALIHLMATVCENFAYDESMDLKSDLRLSLKEFLKANPKMHNDPQVLAIQELIKPSGNPLHEAASAAMGMLNVFGRKIELARRTTFGSMFLKPQQAEETTASRSDRGVMVDPLHETSAPSSGREVITDPLHTPDLGSGRLGMQHGR